MTTPSSIPAPHPAHQATSRHDITSGLRFLEELVQHISSRSSYAEEGGHHTFVPRFDVEIHPESYELYGELPGFDHDHVTVEANDDRNIQISGWISRNRKADPATDPTLAVQHKELPPAKPKAPPTARFGDELDPHAELVHDSPKPASNVTTPAAPPKPTGPETARFGDELDPHAEFVHDPPASTVAHTDPSAPAAAAAAKAKTARLETARFGDELDPHAQFVHRPAAAASASAKGPHTRYLMAERRYGQFHRAFHFPGPFKKEEVTARMDNGILHVTAPKAAVGPPTKVVVKKGGEEEGKVGGGK